MKEMWRARSWRLRRNQRIRLLKPGRRVEDHVLVQHLTANSGMSPTIERTRSGMRLAVGDAAGRSRSRPPRPTGRCRRGCSWRRRSRRSARRTCRRRPRRPGPRCASSSAIASMVAQKNAIQAVPSACSSVAPLGSGCERSKTPMLSSPRKPPAKRLLPLDVLAVHPPGEVDQQLLEGALQEQPVALAARGRSSCRPASRPRRAPAG